MPIITLQSIAVVWPYGLISRSDQLLPINFSTDLTESTTKLQKGEKLITLLGSPSYWIHYFNFLALRLYTF